MSTSAATVLCASQSAQEVNLIFAARLICVQHHAAVSVCGRLSHYAPANKALIDVQINGGMQHMEDLLNTLSFQCWNREPEQGGQVGMAMEECYQWERERGKTTPS